MGRSVPGTRCQRRGARRPAWPEPGEGTGRAPPAPPDPPIAVAAARGRRARAGHPRSASPREASTRGPAGSRLRLRLGSSRARVAGPIVAWGAPARAAPASPRPAPQAAGGPAHVFPLSRSLRPLRSVPPLRSPPSPRFPSSCLVMCRLFLFAVETISRRSARPGPTRRGGGEREAGRGGESGGAGGRTRGAPGGRRRSHAAPRPPRPCRPPPRARRAASARP